MVRAGIVPCPPEALLDGPAQPGSAGRFRKADADRTEDHAICRFPRIPAAAAHRRQCSRPALRLRGMTRRARSWSPGPLDPSPAARAVRSREARCDETPDRATPSAMTARFPARAGIPPDHSGTPLCPCPVTVKIEPVNHDFRSYATVVPGPVHCLADYRRDPAWHSGFARRQEERQP